LGYAESLVWDADYDWENSGDTWRAYDQKEFFGSQVNWNNINLRNREAGWIYIPKVCETSQCRVHVALHGRGGNGAQMGAAGYNALAALNNIIMIYPDTRGWDSWLY